MPLDRSTPAFRLAALRAFALASLMTGLLLAAGGSVRTALAEDAPAKRDPAPRVAQMVRSAQFFLLTLTPEQKAKALFPFEDAERLNWHFIPKPRKGMPMGELTPSQAAAGSAFLSTALSARGFEKAAGIMQLENVLRDQERAAGKDGAGRDSSRYFYSFFGEPSETADWGWRFEGHHMSLNFTFVGGKAGFSASPAFMGASPHEVREGPMTGLRALGKEEDLARDLLASLTDAQRAEAIIAPEAPPDIFTAADRKASLEGPPRGLAAASLTPEQRTKFDALVAEYLGNLQPWLARERRAKLESLTPEQRDGVRFAWMGGTEKGQPHYYRVQTAKFLIEYDNTQNNANHSHTVWRDFEGDFGLDLLAVHHAQAH